MKLLHTSDWHIGFKHNSREFLSDQKAVIEQIFRIAEEEKVDGILVAGDIFHKRIVSDNAVKLYDELISDICVKRGIPVFMIAGNHDNPATLAQGHELLKKGGLDVASFLTEEPHKASLGDVDIYMLPWFTMDKVRTVFPDRAEEIESMEDAFRIVLDNIRNHFVEGRKNILLCHAYLSNAETSTSDEAAEIGGATKVSASLFTGFDYVALGHIHKPQDVRENAKYSGSPMICSFGKEEKQTKSVVIIDMTEKRVRRVNLEQPHKWKTLTETREVLMNADYPDDIRKGYVRLEVTDSSIGLSDQASYYELYPNLLEFSGKDYVREDGKITMTVTEFEEKKNKPEDIFLQYYRDIIDEENAPDAHFLELFRNAVAKYEGDKGNQQEGEGR